MNGLHLHVNRILNNVEAVLAGRQFKHTGPSYESLYEKVTLQILSHIKMQLEGQEEDNANSFGLLIKKLKELQRKKKELEENHVEESEEDDFENEQVDQIRLFMNTRKPIRDSSELGDIQAYLSSANQAEQNNRDFIDNADYFKKNHNLQQLLAVNHYSKEHPNLVQVQTQTDLILLQKADEEELVRKLLGNTNKTMQQRVQQAQKQLLEDDDSDDNSQESINNDEKWKHKSNFFQKKNAQSNMNNIKSTKNKNLKSHNKRFQSMQVPSNEMTEIIEEKLQKSNQNSSKKGGFFKVKSKTRSIYQSTSKISGFRELSNKKERDSYVSQTKNKNKKRSSSKKQNEAKQNSSFQKKKKDDDDDEMISEESSDKSQEKSSKISSESSQNSSQKSEKKKFYLSRPSRNVSIRKGRNSNVRLRKSQFGNSNLSHELSKKRSNSKGFADSSAGNNQKAISKNQFKRNSLHQPAYKDSKFDNRQTQKQLQNQAKQYKQMEDTVMQKKSKEDKIIEDKETQNKETRINSRSRYQENKEISKKETQRKKSSRKDCRQSKQNNDPINAQKTIKEIMGKRRSKKELKAETSMVNSDDEKASNLNYHGYPEYLMTEQNCDSESWSKENLCKKAENQLPKYTSQYSNPSTLPKINEQHPTKHAEPNRYQKRALHTLTPTTEQSLQKQSIRKHPKNFPQMNRSKSINNVFDPVSKKQEMSVMRNLQMLVSSKDKELGKIKMFIQFVEAIHERSCGRHCAHLTKYYNYLKKFNIMPHRKDLHSIPGKNLQPIFQ